MQSRNQHVQAGDVIPYIMCQVCVVCGCGLSCAGHTMCGVGVASSHVQVSFAIVYFLDV